MAVFRVQKTQNYTIMSNHHLRNKALSLKAKGLLSLMLSLPEDWDYTTRGLASMRDMVQICEPSGRILDPFSGAGTTVLAAVQEGYEAVGIEMSDAYFRRSTERLKTALESEVNQN